MLMSYGGFGKLTALPNSKSGVLYLTVAGRRYVMPAPAWYDTAVTVPEIRWGGSPKDPVPSPMVVYPEGSRTPATITINAQRMPMVGEVMPLPGLAGTEPLPAPVSAPAPAPVLAPVPAPAPVVTPPAPAPAPAPVPTGQTTVVDMPGAGPTRLPVLYAPIPAPTIQLGPSGTPVVVLPIQPSNLPTMPTREAVRARLVQEEQEGLPPGMYDPDEFFPLYVPERLPIRATPAKGRAGRADTSAEADQVDVSIWEVRAGQTDLFDRRYPQAKPLRTLPTAPPSPDGLMPTIDVTPQTRQATPETDGAVLVQVPSAKVPDAPGASGQGRIGILIAGTGGGFLIAGPIGAAVGAAAALLLGKGK